MSVGYPTDITASNWLCWVAEPSSWLRLLNLKISVFFLFSHTLTADQRPLHCRFWGNRLSAWDQFPIPTHPPWEIWHLGCAGAHGHTRAPALPAASWPLRLCVFLKRAFSTRARARRGWGAAPLSQLRRALPLRGGRRGWSTRRRLERGRVFQVAWLLHILNGS